MAPPFFLPRLSAALLMFLMIGCPRRPTNDSGSVPATEVPAAAAIRFQELGPESGITSAYQNGRAGGLFAILESLGGGVGLIDFDLDQRLDLVFPGGGQLSAGDSPIIQGVPLSCYRQRSHHHWEEFSLSAGVGEATRYSHGVAVGDADNDGFDDLLITGYGGLDLWRNLGDGTFERLPESESPQDRLWSSSAGWGDLDGDGFLDAYAAHYVDWSPENNPACPSGDPAHPRDICPPRRFGDLDDAVFRNQGDGSFADMSKPWGLVTGGKGLGVMLADVDEDGDTDVYVANDTTNNFLYLNQGQGVLKETGLIAGCAVDHAGKPNGSMGVAWFDFDGDLREDFWITNFEDENSALYRNLGSGGFLHLSLETGISAVGAMFVGFGTAAEDFDGDGDRDIAVANGHVIYYPTQSTFEQEPLLLENLSGRFRRLTFPGETYFSRKSVGRGLAAGDLDQDGRCDLVISNLNSPPTLLINQSEGSRPRLRLKLIGSTANRSAIGARVVLSHGQHQSVRSLIGGGSYLSTSERVCDFHLPAEGAPATATIYWPYGEPQRVDGLLPGRDYIVIQGKPPLQGSASPNARHVRLESR